MAARNDNARRSVYGEHLKEDLNHLKAEIDAMYKQDNMKQEVGW